MSEVRAAVLAAIRDLEPATAGAVVERTGYHRRTVGRHARALVNSGRVTRRPDPTQPGRYVYEIVDRDPTEVPV